jgi:hypothetical protein
VVLSKRIPPKWYKFRVRTVFCLIFLFVGSWLRVA